MASFRLYILVGLYAVACTLFGAAVLSAFSRRAPSSPASALREPPRALRVHRKASGVRPPMDCALPMGLNSTGGDMDDPPPPKHSDAAPLYVARTMGTTIYAKPAYGPPRGVMVAFHGAYHTAQWWFDLVEEHRIVRLCVARGLLFIGVESPHTAMRTVTPLEWGFWHQTYPQSNNSHVLYARDEVLKVLSAEGIAPNSLPMFAGGASGGAAFAGLFATSGFFKVEGVIVQVAALDGRMVLFDEDLPKMCFVNMPWDFVMTSEIVRQVHVLQSRGYHATAAYQILPRPFNEDFLRERLQDAAMAKAWYRAIEGTGLVRDGKVSITGKTLLRAMKALFPTSRETAVSLKELVEVTEAFHMITSKHWNNCFRWFECIDKI